MTERHAKTHILEKIDLASILEPQEVTSRPAECKVICTLGPSCRDVETLVELLEAGMTAARIDLTWGSVDYHKQSLRNLQKASQQTRRMCAVILDIVGRELMIRRDFTLDHEGWPVHMEGFDIKNGQEVRVTADEKAEASSLVLPISYPHFAHMCQPGDTLFVGRYLVNGADQSSLYLEVKDIKGDDVICTALNDAHMDGLLTVIHSERGGDGMSSLQTDLPLLTEYDEKAIKMFIKEHEIDYINLTYTCSGMDVYEMREFLDEHGGENIKIIAKVENMEALRHFDSIAGAADAIIMSRGNLGLDVAPEKTAVVQKAAINRCNLLGRPVIITRLVDSMAEAPRCTRAEATDVANAVLDGVDGMLLGAETLRGKYPVETVRTVLAICRQAELTFDHESHYDRLMARAMEEDEADMMLDSSHHHGDFLSPPGGHSPDGRAAANARPTVETLAHAADAVSRETPEHPENPVVNGVQQDVHYVQPGLPPVHPRTPTSAGRQGSTEGEGSSPSFSASGPMHAGHRFSSSSNRVSSFGTLPRAMSTAVSLGEQAAMADSRRSESAMSKVESIASTAVRAAAKMNAGLIICYAGTGRTASLVAKYRPNVPILTLVVPQLKSRGLAWELEGCSLARQFLIMRGLIPMLAAPMAGAGDTLLSQVLSMAVKRGLVKAKQHVVCVLSVRGDLVLNVCQVDDKGSGLQSNLASLGSELNLPAVNGDAAQQEPVMTF